MSDKEKKENRLINLKLIHVVLAIFLMLLGVGVKYWPKASDPEPTSKKLDPKGNDSSFTVNDNHGTQQIGNNNTFHDNRVVNNDNRVINNYDLNSKGSGKTETSPVSYSSPTKKKIITNYFNEKYSGDIAVIGLENKSGFSSELNTFLKNENYKTTASFFRSNFLQDYKLEIWEQGIDIFESFEIQNNINCACIIKEQVGYREMERTGGGMIAEGNVDLKIVNVKTGESATFSIATGGAGFDKADAYKNMQTNFSKELSLQNQLSKFELCKK